MALAAAIPAGLYYFGLLLQVDAYAARHGLKGMPREELPKMWTTIKEGWYYAFVLEGPWQESLYLTTTALLGSAFICGGLQGYQLFIGDLRASGRVEWPLRILLIIGGFTLAAPGGGIMPVTHAQMAWASLILLAPTLMVAAWLVRRAKVPATALRA